MNRGLLTPRWLLLHLLFAAGVVATGLLAWWQWDRAHEVGGTFQNLGYAFQWPLFGAFTIFLWYRTASMEGRQEDGEDQLEDESQESASQARRRPLVPPPAKPVTEDEDPELAAYNRYLAELNKSESD